MPPLSLQNGLVKLCVVGELRKAMIQTFSVLPDLVLYAHLKFDFWVRRINLNGELDWVAALHGVHKIKAAFCSNQLGAPGEPLVGSVELHACPHGRSDTDTCTEVVLSLPMSSSKNTRRSMAQWQENLRCTVMGISTVQSVAFNFPNLTSGNQCR